ncbi:MAG: PAS domain-containing protein [Proteobacteria bacterium]|nr:PAS domain-containing protein [Pseudomonadota bacterium]MBU1686905.1 PAS domain-containing protein [Pseudomonadota bacterium]
MDSGKSPGTTKIIDETTGEFIKTELEAPLEGVHLNEEKSQGGAVDLVQQLRFNEALLESVPIPVFYKDIQGRYLGCNRAFTEAMGVGPEDIIGKTAYDLWPEQQSRRYHQQDENLLKDLTHQEYEFTIIDKNGDIRDALFSKDVFYDEHGNAEGIVGSFIDITDRKRAEKALRESEDRLNKAQQIAGIGSWQYNLQSDSLWWSDELYRIFAMSPEEGPPTIERFLEKIHPDDRANIQAQIASGSAYRSDYRIILPDNRNKFIHEEVEIYRDENNKPIRYVGTAQDITRRKQAEEQLRSNGEFIRTILDSVDEGFIVVDRDLKIISANQSFCRNNGISMKEAIGCTCYEISHRINIPCYEAGGVCPVKQVFDGEYVESTVHQYLDVLNNEIFIEAKAYPLKDSSGEIIAAVEVHHDITKQRKQEEEQLKLQKLEAIGTLAGGIAHDFNNLLQGVFGFVSLAKITLDNPLEAAEMLEQAEHALSLSVNLTHQLLTFAKGGKPVVKQVSLKPLIESASKFALSGSHCECRPNIPDTLWHANVDAGQLAQVIQNMVLNACESMPDGGSIDITAENVILPENDLGHHHNKGKSIRIKITDHGVGIPERYLSRIFDPYFTTKQSGSGLGLATSYSIIKNHGGIIEVRSNKDQGTTFTITLAAVEAQPKDSLQKSQEVVPKYSARILVMDDEVMVRNLAQRMIQSLGHEVVCTADGEKTLEEYQRALAADKHYDLIILDLTIKGGMGGEETMKQLQVFDPNVKVIVSSGYSDNPILSNFQEYGFVAILNKPYTRDELRSCLQKVLPNEPFGAD